MRTNLFYTGKAEEIMCNYIQPETIDLVVTSPPYDSLRDYKNGASFDFESVAIRLERVIKKGGVLVWIVGDAMIKKSESKLYTQKIKMLIDLYAEQFDELLVKQETGMLEDMGNLFKLLLNDLITKIIAERTNRRREKIGYIFAHSPYLLIV